MKRYTFLLLSILLLSFTAYTQQLWRWQNPSPQGNNLNAVNFLDANTGTAVGDLGTIIRTTDGGSTWSIQSSGTTRSLRGVAFTDANNGVAVGDTGSILHTSDGGNSWSFVTSGTTNALRGVVFSGSSMGWAAGNTGTILHTTDGGFTWATQTSNVTSRLNAVCFISPDTGFAVGQTGGGQSAGVLVKTINGGATWTTTTNTLGTSFTGMVFANANRGIISGTNRLLYTNNGGLNWTIDTVSGSWSGVAFLDSSTVVAVGQNGLITRSTNGGVSWASVSSGTTSTFLGVTNKQSGFVAVSLGGNIMSSTLDGGSWTSLITRVTSNQLYAVHFVNRNIGTAVGVLGTILRTTNAGKTWTTQQSNGAIGTYRGLFFANANLGVATTDSGTISRTTNGGADWTNTQMGIANSMYGVTFLDNQNAYIVGASGVILHSTNGGESWNTQATGNSNAILGVHFLSASVGTVVGSAGTILHTTDGGSNWATQVSGANNTILRSVHFVSDSTGFITGDGGTLLKTTNAGANWTSVNTGTNNALRAIVFSDANNGTIVGATGTMFVTTDAGNSWSTQVSNTVNTLNGVWFTDNNTGTAVGGNGTIIRRQLDILPPSTPQLATPANEATNQQTTLNLEWGAASGADSYHLQVAADSSFAINIIDESGITGTSHQAVLGSNTTYYWRISATNDGGTSDYSEIWHFTTMFVAQPNPPALISPANHSTDEPISLELKWNSSATAVRYHLQVATDSGFTSVIADESTLSDTTHIVGPLAGFTTYYWRVSGKNVGGEGSYSAVWDFKTVFVAPSSAPDLIYPANGAVDVPTTLSLKWHKADGADVYDLQGSIDSNFQFGVLEDSTITDTTKEVDLQSFVTIYWRVRAKNAGGVSAFSNAWHFRTIFVPAPATPVLVSPENNVVNQPRTVTLMWNMPAGAERYHVQLSNDSLFGSFVVNDTTITDTIKQVGPLPNLTKFYWRVKAINVGGRSDFSDVWNFTTVIVAPGVPALVSPNNNSNNVSLTPNVRWRRVERASLYTLQVALDSVFTNFVYFDSTIADTNRIIGPLQTVTRYFWRVRATNAGGSSDFANYRRFTTVPAPPPPPVLSSPVNGADSLSLPVTFVWYDSSTSFLTYKLQISYDSTFTSIAYVDSSIFGDTTTSVGDLSYGTHYYWRMNASTNIGTSLYSQIRDFTTGVAPIAPPVLASPENSAINVKSPYTFKWTPVSGAIGYHIQASTDSLFGFSTVDDTTSDTVYAVTSLQGTMKYFWHVQAGSPLGLSQWSDRWNFTTAVAPPLFPILVSPTNNAQNQSLTPTLRWRLESGATSYTVQVSTDTLFRSFTVDSVVTDTTLQIGPLTNATKYFWHVNAMNEGGASSYSNTRRFTTVAGPPARPELISPVNDTVNVRRPVVFTWSESTTGFLTYHLQIALDSKFGTVVFEDSLIVNTTTRRVDSVLNFGTKYYWRVSAKTLGGASDFSEVWNFTTIVAPPVVPSLAFPENGAQNVERALRLRWHPSENALLYHVQVSNDSGFENLILNDSTVSDTLKGVGPLEPNTSYFWRVRARNMNGLSLWSDAWSFKTIVLGVLEIGNIIPKVYALSQNYPNPFNPATSVQFDVPKQSTVSLKLYDELGQEVSTVLQKNISAGRYSISIDASSLHSGVYFYRFTATAEDGKTFTSMKKMMLLK